MQQAGLCASMSHGPNRQQFLVHTHTRVKHAVPTHHVGLYKDATSIFGLVVTTSM